MSIKKPQKSVSSKNGSKQSCPNGKYWISPHQRKRITKGGKIYIQQVKGYCCSYHNPYQKIAEEEKIPLDHLYFVLTVYGEAGGESIASKRAIAWIIRNRLAKKRWGDSYRKVVLKRNQFACWNKNDPNYKRLQHPGKDGSTADKKAWQKCKEIFKEVSNASKKTNPIPNVCHYFSGKPDIKRHPWEKDYFDLPGVLHFHFVKLDK
jgi:hypothetical protein